MGRMGEATDVSTTGRRWARRKFDPERVKALPGTVTVNGLAVGLGVALSTVQHWIKIGLNATKVKKRWRISRADVRKFLNGSSRLGSRKK